MKTAIMGAMPNEVRELIAMPGMRSAGRTAAIDFYEGEIAGRPAVVALCGVGKVCAAICSQVMIDKFGAGALINIGTAGAMPGELPNGGFVVSSDAVEADLDASPIGYARGENPFTGRVAYEADSRMICAALAACRAARPQIASTVGRVVTMDAFTTDSEVIARVRDDFGGVCMEMEGAAVAHTARQNGVPYVLLRLVTNELNDSAAQDYLKTEAAAGDPLAAAVIEMMRRL